MSVAMRLLRLPLISAAALFLMLTVPPMALATDDLPWKRQAQSGYGSGEDYDVYREAPRIRVEQPPEYRDDRYGDHGGYGAGRTYEDRGTTTYGSSPPPGGRRDVGEPYREPAYNDRAYRDDRYEPPRRGDFREAPPPRRSDGPPSTFSQNEILDAGHNFFGSISQGLASAVEYAFKSQGRPNGYILGEDAGGALIAGLRYGEGTLYTRDAGNHRVYWQGPTVGYDFGAEGSKTMVLVYNLRDPSDIYNRFGGVQGSAYVVGGVSLQLQKRDDIVLAPIRSGVGLRLGANVGYLKYTRAPTWNPF